MSPLCKLGQLTDPSAWAGDVNMLYREVEDPDYRQENDPNYREGIIPDYREEDVPDYIPDKKYSQRERYPTKEMEDGEILMRLSEVIIIIQLVILSCPFTCRK